MSTAPVTDWSEALLTSLAAALTLLLSAIPKVIGFAVILIIGWLIASAIAKAVAALLRAVKFNDLATRGGFTGFVQKMGVNQDASGFIANIAKWFIRLIVLISAFDALGLPAVSQVLQSLLLWLPNLVVALVVLVIAGLAANALGGSGSRRDGRIRPRQPRPAGNDCKGSGVGVRDCDRRESAGHRHNLDQHVVHGDSRRCCAGAWLSLWSGWPRNGRPDRARLVRQGSASRAEDGPGSASRSAAVPAAAQEQRVCAGNHADRRQAEPVLKRPRIGRRLTTPEVPPPGEQSSWGGG